MRRAYRFRVYPTPVQEVLMRRTFGCVRWVWNTLLAAQRARAARGLRRLSYGQTSTQLTTLKQQPEHIWLNEVPSVPLQQTLRHLDRAHRHWREGRAGEPVCKRKHDHREAAEFTRSAFRWDERRRILSLAKIGPLRVRWSRPLQRGCQPSTVTLSRDAAGRTFVSLLVEEEIAPLPPTERVTALDRGLVAWVTTPEGDKVANPRCYAARERQLAHAQRCFSRKRKGSCNREKARVRVARLHARIADARRDALHQLTTRVVSENQAIALETLHVRGLVRNHHLAKAISDAAWGELARQLCYKAAWYGRRVVQATRWFPSSKRCSTCGQVRAKLPLGMRRWTCAWCCTEHDRDVNAAQNLLMLLADEVGVGPAVGHTVAACGGPVRPSGAEVSVGTTHRSRKTVERSPSGMRPA
jgi:putative transposase